MHRHKIRFDTHKIVGTALVATPCSRCRSWLDEVGMAAVVAGVAASLLPLCSSLLLVVQALGNVEALLLDAGW